MEKLQRVATRSQIFHIVYDQELTVDDPESTSVSCVKNEFNTCQNVVDVESHSSVSFIDDVSMSDVAEDAIRCTLKSTYPKVPNKIVSEKRSRSRDKSPSNVNNIPSILCISPVSKCEDGVDADRLQSPIPIKAASSNREIVICQCPSIITLEPGAKCTINPQPDDRVSEVGQQLSSHSVHKAPDGGCMAWCVCFSSFLANGTVFGVINSYGILLVSIMSTYEDDKPSFSQTALIGSICTGITFFFSSISSVFIETLGLRKTAYLGAFLGALGLISSAFAPHITVLYCTFGIILGLGGACLYPPSLVILGHYFIKHMGLVNGIVTCGSVVISATESVVLPHILSSIGLSNTFLVLSFLYILVFFLVILWKPLIPHQPQHVSDVPVASSVFSRKSLLLRVRRKINANIWESRGYKIWVLSLLLASFGYFVPFAFLVSHVKQKMPKSNGAYLLTCIQITSGLSRLVIGRVSDYPNVNRIKLQQAALCLMGIMTSIFPLAQRFEYLIPIALVWGFCDGVYVCLQGPIAYDIVGHKGLCQALGFLLGGLSIPLTLGPVIAGAIRDQMSDYTLAFHVAGVPLILGGLLMSLVHKHPMGSRHPRVASITIPPGMTDKRSPRQKRSPKPKNNFRRRFKQIWTRSNRQTLDMQLEVVKEIRFHLRSHDTTGKVKARQFSVWPFSSKNSNVEK